MDTSLSGNIAFSGTGYNIGGPYNKFIIGYFLQSINRPIWVKYISSTGGPSFTSIVAVAVSSDDKYVAFSTNAMLVIGELLAADGSLVFNSLIGSNTGTNYVTWNQALTIDIRGTVMAGLAYGSGSTDNIGILQCQNPMGVNPTTAKLIFRDFCTSQPYTLHYISEQDQILMGSRVDGCGYGYGNNLNGIAVWDAQTFVNLKWRHITATNGAYIRNTDLNYPYFAGCMTNFATAGGLFSWNYLTEAARIQTFTSSPSPLVCMGTYISSSTGEMNILFSNGPSSSIQYYLGYVSNAFPSGAMTLSVTPVNRGSVNLQGTMGGFNAINSFFIGGYITSTFMQGYIYASSSLKACHQFAIGTSFNLALTQVATAMVNVGFVYPAPTTINYYHQSYASTTINLATYVYNSYCGIGGKISLSAPTPFTSYCYESLDCLHLTGAYSTVQSCTDSLPLTFTLVDSVSGLPLSISLIVQSSTNNNPTLYMLPVAAEIGTYSVRMVAQDATGYLYDQSYVFTLVIRCCCWNYLSFQMIAGANQAFDIAMESSPVTLNEPIVDKCYQSVVYSSTEVGQLSLPYFMTYNSALSSYSMFTSDPSDMATYTIQIVATQLGVIIGTTTFSLVVTHSTLVLTTLFIVPPTIVTPVHCQINCVCTITIGTFYVNNHFSNAANEQITITGTLNGTLISALAFPISLVDSANSVTLALTPSTSQAFANHLIVITAQLTRVPSVTDSSYLINVLVDAPPIIAPTVNAAYDCIYLTNCSVSIGSYTLSPVCSTYNLAYSFSQNGQQVTSLSYQYFQMDLIDASGMLTFYFKPNADQISSSFTINIIASVLEVPFDTDSSLSFLINVIFDYSLCQFTSKPTIQDQVYSVGADTLLIYFDPFTLNQNLCYPITYQAAVSLLPSASFLDQTMINSNRLVKVVTADLKYVQSYSVTITATISIGSGSYLQETSSFLLLIQTPVQQASPTSSSSSSSQTLPVTPKANQSSSSVSSASSEAVSSSTQVSKEVSISSQKTISVNSIQATAFIASVKNNGYVYVDFNQKIKVPLNYSKFNQSRELNLSVVKTNKFDKRDVSFNWTLMQFNSLEMVFKLNFTVPDDVNKQDTLFIKFLDLYLFQPENAFYYFEKDYTISSKLVLQLQDSGNPSLLIASSGSSECRSRSSRLKLDIVSSSRPDGSQHRHVLNLFLLIQVFLSVIHVGSHQCFAIDCLCSLDLNQYSKQLGYPL